MDAADVSTLFERAVWAAGEGALPRNCWAPLLGAAELHALA